MLFRRVLTLLKVVMASISQAAEVRTEIHVQGNCAGVGFRPFVFDLVKRLGLRGFVLNSISGVDIELEGAQTAIPQFLEILRNDARPLISRYLQHGGCCRHHENGYGRCRGIRPPECRAQHSIGSAKNAHPLRFRKNWRRGLAVCKDRGGRRLNSTPRCEPSCATPEQNLVRRYGGVLPSSRQLRG